MRNSTLLRLFVLFSPLFFLLAPDAFAQPSASNSKNIYGGAAVGQMAYEATGQADFGSDADFDESTTSFEIFFGRKFSRNIGIETSFIIPGSVSGKAFEGFDNDLKFNEFIASAEAVGFIPVGNKFELFGNLGISFIATDADYEDPVTTEDATGLNIGVPLGVGGKYNISNKFALRLEYQIIVPTKKYAEGYSGDDTAVLENIEVDRSIVSLGAQYNF